MILESITIINYGETREEGKATEGKIVGPKPFAPPPPPPTQDADNPQLRGVNKVGYPQVVGQRPECMSAKGRTRVGPDTSVDRSSGPWGSHG